MKEFWDGLGSPERVTIIFALFGGGWALFTFLYNRWSEKAELSYAMKVEQLTPKLRECFKNFDDGLLTKESAILNLTLKNTGRSTVHNISAGIWNVELVGPYHLEGPDGFHKEWEVRAFPNRTEVLVCFMNSGHRLELKLLLKSMPKEPLVGLAMPGVEVKKVKRL